MGQLEDLIAQVDDAALRQSLATAASEAKESRNFGLVFEQHIPETVAVLGLPVRRGQRVRLRSKIDVGPDFLVTKATKKSLTLTADDGATLDVDPVDVAVVKRFGEPIYPTLTPICEVRRSERPAHTVINGENYHALQTLLYLYEGQVDCIYIDPPYNTGARDWKYNNRYVDDQDSWRHSKWLSFIEKRLILARRLLKHDGVLIVTIDENEVHHLAMLLEQLFPDARRQMITICTNPSGVSGDGLSRVDEHAMFCFFGGALPTPTTDDMLTRSAERRGAENLVAWESLLRRGNAWYRAERPNLCYPVLLSDDGTRIVGVGEPFTGQDEAERPNEVDGHPAAWPVRRDGNLGIWRVEGERLVWLAERGYAQVTRRDEARTTWTLKYLMTGTVRAIERGEIQVLGTGERGEALLQADRPRRTVAKTLWNRGRHTAGAAWGTQLVNGLLGERNLFTYPKSLYAVRDCIEVAVGDRPDALILDYFAGSGTTLHATCLLNAEDDGHRRSVIVTNNEVAEAENRRLLERGFYRGDAEYETSGVFERVTRPRCTAAITGATPQGQPVDGDYLNGLALSDGFEEAVEYYKLNYLDPDSVRLGDQLGAILPMLRLAAGAIGEIPAVDDGAWLIPEDGPWAVLLDDSRFAKFRALIERRPELTKVWLVTTSEESFARLRTQLAPGLTVSMLYRDYLRSFEINMDQP
ncbi:MAG: site-specific DNA-methyltransferase [Actinomycetota bacterium]|nr:site-specific DNA-methyltransferase [Actinomycetota bacterium]